MQLGILLPQPDTSYTPREVAVVTPAWIRTASGGDVAPAYLTLQGVLSIRAVHMAAVLGIILGVVATVGVGRYYFEKSRRTELSVYVHHISRIFRGVDDDLRRSLNVSFNAKPVSDLVDIRLLVANDGSTPIRDYLEPLRIAIPAGTHLLDAALLHAHPAGRDVEVLEVEGSGGTAVECRFPLLNPGDFFLFRMLLDGPAGPIDLPLSITAENLPPMLRPRFGSYSTADRRSSPWGALAALAAFWNIAGALWWLIKRLHDLSPNFIPWVDARLNATLADFAAVVIVTLIASLLTMIGFGFAGASILGGSLPRERVFPLPRHPRARGHPRFNDYRLMDGEFEAREGDTRGRDLETGVSDLDRTD